MLVKIFFIKSLKETIRKKNLVMLLFLFPIVIITFFALVFGGSLGDSQPTYHIGIVNKDNGFSQDLNQIFDNDTLIEFNRSEILNDGFGAFFKAKLSSLNYESTNKPIFRIDEYSAVLEVESLLQERSLSAAIVINQEFTESFVSGINNKIFLTSGSWITNAPRNVNTTIILKGDPALTNFQTVNSLIQQFLTDFENDFTKITSIGSTPLSGLVSVEENSILSIEVNNFTYLVPGFMIFGIILSVGLVAGALVSEKENKTLERIRLTRAPGSNLLIGVFLTQIIIAFLQVVLMILTAIIFGFTFLGSILDILIIILLTEFSVIALGLLIASISSKADDANAMGSLISAPIGFISGSFLPLPDISLIDNIIPVADGTMRSLQVWDFIPTFHAVNAVRSISFYGTSIFDLWFEVIILLVTGISLLILSIVIYTKRQLNRS